MSNFRSSAEGDPTGSNQVSSGDVSNDDQSRAGVGAAADAYRVSVLSPPYSNSTRKNTSWCTTIN